MSHEWFMGRVQGVTRARAKVSEGESFLARRPRGPCFPSIGMMLFDRDCACAKIYTPSKLLSISCCGPPRFRTVSTEE